MKNNTMNELRVNWDSTQALSDGELPLHVRQLRKKLKELGHELSGECTYVYHGCNGDCEEGFGRVDAYCDGGGRGPEPDYWFCMEC